MTSAEYWHDRGLQNATRIFKYSDRQGQMIARWFRRAANEMDAKARTIIRKYAGDNGLTYAQAKAELTDPAALSELTENYDKLLAVAPSDPVAKYWLDQLHAAKRMNRENFLKAQLHLIAGTVFADYETVTYDTMAVSFEESYYKSLFDQQQYVGFGSSFNRLSPDAILAATSTALGGRQGICGYRISSRRWPFQRARIRYTTYSQN